MCCIEASYPGVLRRLDQYEIKSGRLQCALQQTFKSAIDHRGFFNSVVILGKRRTDQSIKASGFEGKIIGTRNIG